ncbi:MAG: two-component system, OmpR family, sensor kinase [Pseudonocardiales bacterium]|nr:hypothetical protein [Pseudonocardiales bacterium]MDT4970785.1 two-component system, OmpR family, sensor kinase [Pseudonocardiales bacterium]
MPIRVRLPLLFTAATLVLLTVGGFLFISQLRSGLQHNLDVTLRSRADTLITQLGNGGFQDSGQAPLAPSLGTYAQVLTTHGVVLESSDGLSTTPLLTPAQAAASAKAPLAVDKTVTLNAAGQGGPDAMRMYATPTDQPGVVIAVVTSRDTIDQAVARSSQQLLILGAIALLLAGPGSWLLTRAALRPVERMRTQAADLQEDATAGGLAVPRTRDEIFRLAETLNGLLSRLHAALRHERAFVADAGHELRTPLTVLQGELELARRPGRTRAELAATVDVAAEETDRLVRLAEDLLVLGRDSESPALRSRPFDLTELAEAAIHAASSSAAARDVKIALSAPTGSTAFGDPDRIRQAVDNLLTNAVRHSPSGATVAVGVETDEQHAQVTVTDQGAGFAPDFIPIAFERFTRADQARSRTTVAGVPGGSGLGLAIVRSVMVTHGGSAVAANVNGSGARVTLRWPVGRPDGDSANLIGDTSR